MDYHDHVAMGCMEILSEQLLRILLSLTVGVVVVFVVVFVFVFFFSYRAIIK